MHSSPRRSYTSIFVPISVICISLVFAITQIVRDTMFEQQAASSTTIGVTLFLHGIGNGGDNTAPGTKGNLQPVHTQRDVTLDIYNSTNQLVQTIAGSVTYSATAGNFGGIFDAGTLATGVYQIRLSSPHYLSKFLPGIQTLTAGQSVALQPLHLIAGDSNLDNKLSVADYTVLLDCWSSDLKPAANCADTTKKQQADINDDGNVNEFDYNLFLRELAVQGFDEDSNVATPMPSVTLLPPTVTPRPTATPTPTSIATPTPTQIVPTTIPFPTALPTSIPTPTFYPTPTKGTMGSHVTVMLSESTASVAVGQVYTYTVTAFSILTSPETITITDTFDSRIDPQVTGTDMTNGTCTVTGRTVTCMGTALKSNPATIHIAAKLNATAHFNDLIPNFVTGKDSAGVSSSSVVVSVRSTTP